MDYLVKKGGWDCLRHYEIVAAGSLLMLKNLDSKPQECSPQYLNPISYSSYEDAIQIMNRLVINNEPTDEYKNIIYSQRKSLLETSTCRARAQKLIDDINLYLKNGWD